MTHCKDCIYFDRYDQGSTWLGTCKIDPPVIVEFLQNKTGMWPIVHEDGWCGQGMRS